LQILSGTREIKYLDKNLDSLTL